MKNKKLQKAKNKELGLHRKLKKSNYELIKCAFDKTLQGLSDSKKKQVIEAYQKRKLELQKEAQATANHEL